MTTVLLFDLGGVLYDINLKRTQDSLSLLAGRTVDFTLTSQHKVFDAFECGMISDKEFISSIRSAYDIDASDEEIENAWNALLIGLKKDSNSIIKQIKNYYTVSLLSNINSIHHQRIANECAELFGAFDNLFLSYQLGLRKPQREIFEYVLNHLNTSPENIAYFDDSPQHIATAQSMGITTHHITDTNPIGLALSTYLH